MRQTARLISLVFHPLLVTTWMVVVFGMVNKYAFGALPVNKSALIIFMNTFFFPAFSVFLMWRLGFIPDMKLEDKKDRTIPFFAAMIFYIWSFMVTNQLQMPVFLQVFVLGTTLTIFLSFIINIFYKVSLHMAGVGGVIMLLLLLIFTGGIDVAHMLIGVVLLAGIIGTARLQLGAHTLNELYYGLLLGFIGQIAGFLLFSTGITAYL